MKLLYKHMQMYNNKKRINYDKHSENTKMQRKHIFEHLLKTQV